MVNALTPQQQCIIEYEGLAPSMRNEHILKNINKSDCNILLNFYSVYHGNTSDYRLYIYVAENVK